MYYYYDHVSKQLIRQRKALGVRKIGKNYVYTTESYTNNELKSKLAANPALTVKELLTKRPVDQKTIERYDSLSASIAAQKSRYEQRKKEYEHRTRVSKFKAAAKEMIQFSKYVTPSDAESMSELIHAALAVLRSIKVPEKGTDSQTII